MCLLISDGVTRISKLRHAVERSYPVMGQNNYTLLIQQLVERIRADRIAFTSRPAAMLPMLPESVSKISIQIKNLN